MSHYISLIYAKQKDIGFAVHAAVVFQLAWFVCLCRFVLCVSAVVFVQVRQFENQPSYSV